MKYWKLTSLFAFSLLMIACSSSDNDPDPGIEDNFDRAAMLAHWADGLIIPAYTNYNAALSNLQSDWEGYLDEERVSFEDVRESWHLAYTEWQKVSMFEIGPAEALNLRNFTNVYPADVNGIEANIQSGDFNLQLPSTNDQQGFPALDYLFYGLRAASADIEALLLDEQSSGYRDYVTAIITRMAQMGEQVQNEWNNGFRDSFVSNSGSSASSSVDKLVNDYIFYYEKALRAGKVGIPAGVFSGTPLPNQVEAFYSRFSNEYLRAALVEARLFFNGTSGPSQSQGPGLTTYLDFLDTERDGERLSQLIVQQFVAAEQALDNLDNDFATQIELDNTAMLMLYDELQKLVVLLKVDMLQAINVQVDFVDADGD